MIARNITLALSQAVYRRLRAHLFPGDGFEAAALLLCASAHGRRQKFLVRDIVEVPHAACSRRTPDTISWPGEFVEMAIERAEEGGLVIFAAHSHPGGLFAFSNIDDASDQLLMPALFHGTDRECGSAIMVPSGALRARMYDSANVPTPVDLVTCVGDDLSLWWNVGPTDLGPVACPLAFTSGMTDWLGRMSACVIGVSGTGSVVAEQLARLGFGEIILIDFDKIEERNLNRILNSTVAHVESGALKVDMFAGAVRRYRPGCEVVPIPQSIATREAVVAACESDILFSCVDTAEGRHIADRVGASFLMPLFDVGVSIPTRATASNERVIAEVCGRIDYVRPGGSTLRDRGVYDPAMLEAEYLARAAPEAHRRKIADGYLRGIEEQAPAVITLNMRAASACVMEFIARTFPFRHVANADRARTVFTLSDGDEDFFAEREFAATAQFLVGVGLQEPLLGLPAFAKKRGQR